MLRSAIAMFAVCVALSAAACGSTSSSSTTAPTTAATPTTQTFSGTIAQTQSATDPFTVNTTGSIQVTLTSVAPLATMAIGVGVTTGGSACGTTNIVQNDNARANTTALSGVSVAGSYCVEVYDSGNIPDSSSATYTVQVVHP